MGFAQKLYHVLWIYSYASLALLSGIALLPSYFLITAAWQANEILGLQLVGQVPWYAALLRGLLVTTSLPLGFFLFGLSLIVVMALVRPLLGRSREGETPLFSLKMWQFYNYDGLLLFFSLVYAPFLRSTSLYPVYLRLMGAKVGKNVILNSSKIYDHDLLEIGDDTIIGGDVILIAHVAEGAKVLRKRVKIGKGVTIGQNTSIFPGVQIGDHCIIGAHSLLLKNTVVPPNSVWGGVPARPLRGDRPQEA